MGHDAKGRHVTVVGEGARGVDGGVKRRDVADGVVGGQNQKLRRWVALDGGESGHGDGGRRVARHRFENQRGGRDADFLELVGD